MRNRLKYIPTNGNTTCISSSGVKVVKKHLAAVVGHWKTLGGSCGQIHPDLSFSDVIYIYMLGSGSFGCKQNVLQT